MSGKVLSINTLPARFDIFYPMETMVKTKLQSKPIMKTPLKQLLFWAPRVLCLLFAAFISLFAADVFDAGYGFWKTMLALLVHLIPTWLILIGLAVSWRREWVGAALYTTLGILYLVMFWGRFVWYVYLFIAGPLILVGGLFLLNWFRRSEPRPIS